MQTSGTHVGVCCGVVVAIGTAQEVKDAMQKHWRFDPFDDFAMDTTMLESKPSCIISSTPSTPSKIQDTLIGFVASRPDFI